ncbi:hypothetical protein [Streptomyces sp. NBC_00154]|uniref:hypothetical protein n=1 Tax=Streptomyces sp. NBC_00154 TaxID=2975670 RepID=UPI00224DB3C1|nr:hypothetical protein [Streptomyces sp. NBC_00154]MCX5317422.1 hypothetical protein [Streptomyces sp. NBC_00154]
MAAHGGRQDQITAEIGFATAASLRQDMSGELGVSRLAYRRTLQAAGASMRAAGATPCRPGRSVRPALQRWKGH